MDFKLLSVLILCTIHYSYSERDLPKAVYDNIHSHQADVTRITDYILDESRAGMTYDKLANFTDKFGHRLTGSQVLEDSIDYMLESLENAGFKVTNETVTIPKWERNLETALWKTSYRNRSMALLGLGGSVDTNGTIEAEIVVVTSFDQLESLGQAVKDKIVVYNQKWTEYGESVTYRSQGASRAAQQGAVAALVRSVTGYSIYSPHTGQQNYETNVTQIPVACIAVEDAELLHRMYQRGETITVELTMGAQNFEETTSRNVIAEIPGTDNSGEVVIFGGHIDSWDVGQGVMDDAGGCMISWMALTAIKALGLKPKRTMRLIMWTGEEQGMYGGDQYYETHKDELTKEKLVLAMESDYGVFTPMGVQFNGSGLALAYMEEIMSMIDPKYNLSGVEAIDTFGGLDVRKWFDAGVPTGSLYNDNRNYFNYHHSEGDTITVYDRDEMDRATVAWAVSLYVVANIDDRLPRTGDYPRTTAAASHVTQLTLPALFIGFILIQIVKRF